MAVKDLAGLLPSSDADKKKWLKWGPSNIVDLLAKISGAVSIIATAISVYACACRYLCRHERNRIDAITSATSAQRTIIRGLRSIMALYTWRSAS